MVARSTPDQGNDGALRASVSRGIAMAMSTPSTILETSTSDMLAGVTRMALSVPRSRSAASIRAGT